MSSSPPELRPLGPTSLRVSPVAMGCWPIAGVTSLGVNDLDSLLTLSAAVDAGINFFDTAYCYGPQGESESLLRCALGFCRDSVVIATKGGIHYGADGAQEQDARPATLKRECDESLSRLGTDRVELYYLHSPDPQVDLSDSAGALARLIEAGKALAAGASNCTLEQLQQFHQVCPLAAVQLPYNMLQRDIEHRTIPWCRSEGIAMCVYWPLMKGLLAGRIGNEAPLDPCDKRHEYPMYRGEEWEKNQLFVARLRDLAAQGGHTVAQLVVNWTLSQAGVTSVLCGAKRAWQIEETAGAMGWRLSDADCAAIDAALVERGKAAAKRVFD